MSACCWLRFVTRFVGLYNIVLPPVTAAGLILRPTNRLRNKSSVPVAQATAQEKKRDNIQLVGQGPLPMRLKSIVSLGFGILRGKLETLPVVSFGGAEVGMEISAFPTLVDSAWLPVPGKLLLFLFKMAFARPSVCRHCRG